LDSLVSAAPRKVASLAQEKSGLVVAGNERMLRGVGYGWLVVVVVAGC